MDLTVILILQVAFKSGFVCGDPIVDLAGDCVARGRC